jgi:phenylalanyl-tRNA synthetase alpha chain
LHEYELAILNLLKKQKSIDFNHLQETLNISNDSVLWALGNLSKNKIVKVEKDDIKTARLTEEGKNYTKLFPEEEFVRGLSKSGGEIPLKDVKNDIGLIWAKKNGWVSLDKNKARLTAKGAEIATGKNTYEQKSLLGKLGSAPQNEVGKLIIQNEELVKNLKNRDLLEIIDKGIIKNIQLTEKGAELKLPEAEGIGALTREIIVSGKWKKERLRAYDINANVEDIYPARLHPMHEFIDTIRNAWLNMGFTEVSGPIIESAFWNFDALFEPQDHPARDMQDTFFLKNPSKISIDDIALMNRVKRMHVKNWNEAWREDIAQQALLRTQTTSVSAHYINKFAKMMETNYPIKLFSVGKVFRNESIDYKHLAELHQIDGIIIGTNLTLSNLIYVLKQFYSQIGMDNIIIKPSYFPFVEPGLEINYYDKKKETMIELCGAGIIRKEITKAMGTSKTVLAWGGGLERLMFKVLGIGSLTELYKNDLGWIRKRGELQL